LIRIQKTVKVEARHKPSKSPKGNHHKTTLSSITLILTTTRILNQWLSKHTLPKPLFQHFGSISYSSLIRSWLLETHFYHSTPSHQNITITDDKISFIPRIHIQEKREKTDLRVATIPAVAGAVACCGDGSYNCQKP